MNGAIALCGFMGSGKSTLGKLLAESLGKTFFDLDSFIEEREGHTVSEIFSLYGEEGFRDLEHEALKLLSSRNDAVLALGGGAVLFGRNLRLLKENGATLVFLDAPLALLKKRLKDDNTRPLLDRDDREKFMEELYIKRDPIYRSAADLIFPVLDLPKAENAERLLKALTETG